MKMYSIFTYTPKNIKYNICCSTHPSPPFFPIDSASPSIKGVLHLYSNMCSVWDQKIINISKIFVFRPTSVRT